MSDNLRELLAGLKHGPAEGRVGKPELKELPLRAKLALAARAVSRVHPIYRTAVDDPHGAYLTARVDDAIAFAEAVGNGMSKLPPGADSIEQMAEDAAGRAFPGAGPVAKAAAHLAAAGRAALEGDPEKVWFWCAEALLRAYKVTPLSPAGTGDLIGSPEARAAARADYDRLRGLDLGKPMEVGRPVDVSAGGPLGPLAPSNR
jgi:hypothetical protein